MKQALLHPSGRPCPTVEPIFSIVSMQRRFALLAGACLAFGQTNVGAQAGLDYPSKLIKIVVPFPPGGATDIMTRNVAQMLNDAWRQTVVVENRAGQVA